MTQLARLAAMLGLGLLWGVGVAASEPPTADPHAVTGLEMFDQTFGPATSSCELGFLAVGAPLVVTRLSAFADSDGLIEADTIIAVNGKPVADGSGLRDALGSLKLSEGVGLVVQRDKQPLPITLQCRDASELLLLREEALQSAMASRWNDCIHATYAEEMLWGGPNSQSAGLRLWCHQARQRSQSLGTAYELQPLDARLLFEYVERLLVELRHASGDTAELRARLDYQAQRIAESGHTDLAEALNELLIARVSH